MPGRRCSTRRSRRCSARHEGIAAAIPDTNLVIVTGAGHMLPLEAPETVNQAIAAWLES